MSNTLTECLEAFLGKYTNPNSRKALQRDLLPAINWLGASKRIDQLTRLDIARYIGACVTSPTARSGQPYAPNTVRTKLKALTTFLNWCHRNELITSRLSEVIELPREPQTDARNNAYSPDQCDLLIDYAEGHTPHAVRKPRDLALFLFCYDTGARASSLAFMRRKHIDLATKTAQLFNTKRGRWYTAPFGHYTALILKEWLAILPNDPDAFMWNSLRPGEAIGAHCLSQIPSRACERLGIPKHGIHGFRRGVGVRMVDSGFSTEYVADVLNDSVLVAQKHYAPREIPAAKDAARSLSYTPKHLRKVRKFNVG